MVWSFFTLFFFQGTSAQENIKQIFLHFNKNKYISGENIYFSSYLLKKDSKKLHLPKEYIYINLLDEQGNVIDTRITLSTNGKGSGSFMLNNEIKSGQYFVQAHTYDMNFLDKDHSSVYPLDIVNLDSGLIPDQSNSKKINIELFPEGGNLVEGIFNSCVVQISDVFYKPMQLDSLILFNSRDSMRQAIKINGKGLGKFSYIPKKGVDFHLYAYYKNQVLKFSVMKPQETGYVLMANTDHERQEVGISLNTNLNTFEKYGAISMNLVVDGNEDIEPLIIPFKLNDTKKELLLPYSNFRHGLNSIRLVDHKNSVLASRTIFILKDLVTTYPQVTFMEKENDSLTIRLKTNLGGNQNYATGISLSILPENTVSTSNHLSVNQPGMNNEILFIQNHLRNKRFKLHKEQLYDTDLSLLTEFPDTTNQLSNNKLNISNLLDLNGHANNFKTENDSMSVMLYSQENELFETTPLALDNTFKFENISIKNNSDIYLTLLDKNGQSIYADFFFSIQPIKTKYRYEFSLNKNQENSVTLKPMELPMEPISKEIKLDEVEVVENKLRFGKFFGNFHGRKVDSTMLSYFTLGDYIRSLGFRNIITPEGEIILAKNKYNPLKRFSSLVSPGLVFNGKGAPIMDYADVRMELIDEIYYRDRNFIRNGAGVSSTTDGGLIIVFTNEKYLNHPNPSFKKISKKFTINKGYDLPGNFIRPSYFSFEDIGYKNWGVIGWFPQLKPDENGIITFKIPADGQKKLKLQLVGTTMEGELFKQNIIQRVPN